MEEEAEVEEEEENSTPKEEEENTTTREEEDDEECYFASIWTWMNRMNLQNRILHKDVLNEKLRPLWSGPSGDLHVCRTLSHAVEEWGRGSEG